MSDLVYLTPPPKPLTAEQGKAVRQAWDAIPPVTHCKGLCYDSCTKVPILPAEAFYLIDKHAALITIDEHGSGFLPMTLPTLGPRMSPCQFLENNRCSIYNDRPMICRAFGHRVATLTCTHGCYSTQPLTQDGLTEAFANLIRITNPGLRNGNDFETLRLAFEDLDAQIGELHLGLVEVEPNEQPPTEDEIRDMMGMRQLQETKA